MTLCTLQAAEFPEEADPDDTASLGWQETSKEKLSLVRLKAANGFYACKAWVQRAGHVAMGWFSAAVVWLQQLWPKVSYEALRFWHWILIPFHKTAQ